MGQPVLFYTAGPYNKILTLKTLNAMTLKNKIFQVLLGNVQEIVKQKWTLVAMDYREEFIALANAWDVYPCGGAFTDDNTKQVFYID